MFPCCAREILSVQFDIALWFAVHRFTPFYHNKLIRAVPPIVARLFAVLCCPVLRASVWHSSSPRWLWNLISSLLLSVTLPFLQQRGEVHPLDPSLGKHNPVPVIFPKQRSLPYIREGGAGNRQHAKPNGWKKNILCWNFCGLRLKAETKCFTQLRFILLQSLSLQPPQNAVQQTQIKSLEIGADFVIRMSVYPKVTCSHFTEISQKTKHDIV